MHGFSTPLPPPPHSRHIIIISFLRKEKKKGERKVEGVGGRGGQTIICGSCAVGRHGNEQKGVLVLVLMVVVVVGCSQGGIIVKVKAQSVRVAALDG